jgi:starch phosphorylase
MGDGWWVEGHLEHLTGWSIGSSDKSEESDDDQDAKEIYNKLEYMILPMYFNKRNDLIEVMRNCIALNASFFNTQRMVAQYVLNAYFL